MTSTSLNNQENANQEAILQTDAAIAEVEKELSALTEDDSMLGSTDITELLERLSNADNMARDMETKIDNVLENLDNLLDMLNSSESPQNPPLEPATSQNSVSEQDQPSSTSTASVKETETNT